MIQPTKEAWQPVLEKKLPALLHLFAWGVYATLVFYGNYARISPLVFFIHYGLAFGMHASSFYLNYGYLVPRTLPRHSIAWYLGINLLAAVLLAAAVLVLENVLLPEGDWVNRLLRGELLPLMTRICNYIVFALLGLFVRLFVDWQSKLKKERERENEHLKSELAVLKAQINPHFLFNSLNNLYALSLRQAPETPGVILRISEMMRYLLYETNAETVPLEKEIDMIRTYVAMHEIRPSTAGKINFQTAGNMEGVMIEPLLLLPLVENVFKHGSLPISIRVSLDSTQLRVCTENNLRAAGPETSGGVGLANLRRRLTLLYRDSYELSLNRHKESFTAELSIDLNIDNHD